MVEQSGLVIESQQQRADQLAARPVAKAAHHAVGGAQPLDLDHGALAFKVRGVQALGHHPFQPRVVQPGLSHRSVLGAWRDRQPRVVEDGDKVLQRAPAFAQGFSPQVLARRRTQHVEQGQGRRRLPRQAHDARRRRMQAHLQGLEGKAPAGFDQQLAVEGEHLGANPAQRLDDLREVAPERLARLGLEPHPGALAQGDAAEAVPLGLEPPSVALRQRGLRPGLHGGHDLEHHAACARANSRQCSR